MRAIAVATCLLAMNACVIVDDGGTPPADFDAEIDASTGVTPDAAPRADAGPDAATGACTTDDDCEGARRCSEGRCVACFADTDCVAGYVCEAGECAEGCRDDAPCPAGQLCADGACVPGCTAERPCPQGEGCIEGGCVPCEEAEERPPECPEPACDCAADADCAPTDYCDACTCEPGCRDDAGCAEGERCALATHTCEPECAVDADCQSGICDGGRCVPRGVGCRDDAQCNAGDRCDGARCVPAGEDCIGDAYEPNDSPPTATALELGRLYDQVGICPGDVDVYAVEVPADHTLSGRLRFADPAPVLVIRVSDAAGATLADGLVGNATTFIEYTAPAAATVYVEIRGADAQTRTPYTFDADIEAPPMCVDTRVYPDRDADGFGVDAGAESRCLDDDATPAGFARQTGDCRPADPWAHPRAPEICGDWVDDDCDGQDARCPESQPAVQVPAWACEDDRPPVNVYAYARFDDGRGYFRDRGCFVFFEGLPGEFYVKRALDRARNDAACSQLNGCTCPSLNGWPSYDRRLYAFTLAGDDPAACAAIEIIDHGGETQPVSNDCRKYLYQLHFYDIPYSFIAAGREAMERRLTLFPTVEVACAADRPHANLPYQSLLTAPIRRNAGYRPL